MRIFINALSLSNAYGIGRYTRALLQGLERVDSSGFELCVYLRRGEEAPFAASRTFRFFHPLMPQANRLYLEQIEIPALTARLAPRVYFSPDFTLPTVCNARVKIVTVHDVLIYTHPESVSPRARLLYRTFLPRAVASANVILADSSATKHLLALRHPAAEAKITVVYPALDAMFLDENRGSDNSAEPIAISRHTWLDGDTVTAPFILYVGGFSPRKNVKPLANNFAETKAQMKYAANLVLVGGDGSMHMPANGIIDVGFQSDDVVVQLYRRALGLALISQSEGFGYPVAEALACGCPVLTTRDSAMSEISPDGKGVIEINPDGDAEIKAGLIRLVEENEALRSRIDVQDIRRRFGPERFAREFLSICRETTV